jgi:hypothetical protein
VPADSPSALVVVPPPVAGAAGAKLGVPFRTAKAMCKEGLAIIRAHIGTAASKINGSEWVVPPAFRFAFFFFFFFFFFLCFF